MNTPDPVRITLVNVVDGERLEVLANPTEFTETHSASFERHVIPGLDYRPLHYTGSDNVKWKMVFWIDAHVAAERGGSFDVQGFANFMRGFLIPALVNGQPDTRPPRMLIVWPKILQKTVHVVSLELKFTQFAADLSPIAYTATCELEDARNVRAYSGEVRDSRSAVKDFQTKQGLVVDGIVGPNTRNRGW